jgi:adenylosuccinate lyase/3-carboxy-cis,cis-muconate cycloisomerase
MPTGLDDDLLRDFFGNADQRRIFDARARLQAWLDVERALAETQAELGVIPAEAAERIAAACDAEDYDLDALRAEINDTQHPIVPVVHALEHRVGDEAARFVHFGATTQDIMDTGQALQLRASLDLIEADLDGAIAAARALAAAHRDVPQAGRTHCQHAVPITFGLKAATWLDELARARERLGQARERVLAVQLFGAAGTMAAYGPEAEAIKAGVAARLGLADAAAPWHATRDRIAELGAVLSLLAGAAERIAAEVVRLQSTEVGEVAEPLREGHIGSSTMPQKRNPHLSEALVAKARIVHGLSATLLRNGAHLHERDMSAWALEWLALPELMIVSGAVAADLRVLLDGLTVDAERMRANLELSGGQIVAEGLMMALDPAIGRNRAHELLVTLTREADATRRPFGEVAADHPDVRAHLSPDEVAAALDPGRYTGRAGAIVDRTLAEAARAEAATAA